MRSLVLYTSVLQYTGILVISYYTLPMAGYNRSTIMADLGVIRPPVDMGTEWRLAILSRGRGGIGTRKGVPHSFFFF